MGACASKPEVLKDADGYPKTPEPAPHDPNKTLHHQISDANVDKSDKKVVHEEQSAEEADHKLLAYEIVDDDQANKRRSLSLLFKQNEDVKVSTENEETQVEETVRQEPSETEKQESAMVEEKPSGENQSNEVLKQESLGSKEKCSEESESDTLAVTQESSEESEDEDIVKQELAEVKIPKQLSGSRDEPSEAGKSSEESETPVKEVATEKVTEVADEEAAAKYQTKLTEESTVGKQENNQYVVERAFKVQVSP